MYTDTIKHCASCPQCAIMSGSARVNRPPLHPITVQRAFQIVGVDIMDLPVTDAGNKHVVILQDFQMAISFPCVRSEGYNHCCLQNKLFPCMVSQKH